MNATVLCLALVAYAVCGFLSYGKTFAHFQRKYPSLADKEVDSDKRFALFAALAGPISLIASLIKKDHYGFLWRVSSRDKRRHP